VRILGAMYDGSPLDKEGALTCCLLNDEGCFPGNLRLEDAGDAHIHRGWRFTAYVGRCERENAGSFAYVRLARAKGPQTWDIPITRVEGNQGQTVMCMKTIYCDGLLDDQPSFREWFHYHRLIGASNFAIYAQDVLNVDMYRDVLHEARTGRLTVTDFTPAKRWPMISGNQILFMHDCLLRHSDAEFVFFTDFDEWVYIAEPSLGLAHHVRTLMEQKHGRIPPEMAHLPVVEVKLQQYMFAKNVLPVDRIATPEPLVTALLCKEAGIHNASWLGRQKFVVRPSLVRMAQVHGVTMSLGSTVVAPADYLRVNHYRDGDQTLGSQTCQELDTGMVRWHTPLEEALAALRAESNALGSDTLTRVRPCAIYETSDCGAGGDCVVVRAAI